MQAYQASSIPLLGVVQLHGGHFLNNVSLKLPTTLLVQNSSNVSDTTGNAGSHA